ncbi:MAG: alpha/beta hydrolase [Chloroflexota bacterium]
MKIPANNTELFYDWKGNPDGPVIVFVNGLLTDTASWNAHLPFFTGKYRCLVWDCRGQGQSDKPDEVYDTKLHTADLAVLVDKLGIEKAHFVGLSNGGAAVLEYAANHSDRVLSVVATGAYASVDTILRVKLTSWISAMECGGSPLRFDVAMPWVWGGGFLEKNYQAALLPFREKGVNMPIEWAMNLIKGAMVHDIREKLPLIAAPVLAIVGEEDVLTPPRLSSYISQKVQDGRLKVMQGIGHAAALEDVEGWSRIVNDFLESVERGEA